MSLHTMSGRRDPQLAFLFARRYIKHLGVAVFLVLWFFRLLPRLVDTVKPDLSSSRSFGGDVGTIILIFVVRGQ